MHIHHMFIHRATYMSGSPSQVGREPAKLVTARSRGFEMLIYNEQTLEFTAHCTKFPPPTLFPLLNT